MALIKFGMMMTDARGKLGGHVFTKARNGATVRTKVTPTNPQTPAQSIARAIFADMSQAWRALNEESRASFNAAVGNFAKTNIFGDSYNPSGKNLFVSLNCNRLNVGLAFITTAPLPSGTEPILLGSVEIDNTAEEINITLIGSEPGVGFVKVIEASSPFSPGRYNFSGSYAKIASWTTAALDNNEVLYQAYLDKYGAPEVGTKVSFRSYTVNADTGEKSAYSIVTTIVAL